MKKNTFSIYAIISIVAIVILTIFNIVYYREKHESNFEINDKIKVNYVNSDPTNGISDNREFSFDSENKCQAWSFADGVTTISFSGEWFYKVSNLKIELPEINIRTNEIDYYTYNVYYNNELIETNYIEDGIYKKFNINRIGKNQPIAYGKIETGDIEFISRGEGVYTIELIVNINVNGKATEYMEQKEITLSYVERK